MLINGAKREATEEEKELYDSNVEKTRQLILKERLSRMVVDTLNDILEEQGVSMKKAEEDQRREARKPRGAAKKKRVK